VAKHQIITNNTCPNTDAELLLVSRRDYTVKIDDAVSTIVGNIM
jgi:hypothetical protein